MACIKIIMATQKEMLEEILSTQKKQGDMLLGIDMCLNGPEMDPEQGGLTKLVHQNVKCIKDIKKKQSKIITWGITIVGALNLGGAIALIVSVLKR